MAAVALSPQAVKAALVKKVQAALVTLRDTPEYRAEVEARIRGELFPLQLAVLDDKSRRMSVCCSRRAGKSELMARMIALSLMTSGTNEYTVFCARTLAIAKKIVWSLLTGINNRYMLGWKTSEHTGTITAPSGAVFQLVGVDDSASVEKVRGSKYRLVICDEASTYQEYLEKLIVDCFSPGTKDFRPAGRIVIAGTPGYVCKGYWFDVANGNKPAFSQHYWTLRQNPHIPDADEALAEEREANNWTETDPVYLREYEGRWLNDGDALVYAYSPERNAISKLPEPFDPDTWLTTLAGDIGYTDDFAIAVLGSPPHSKDIYVLYAFKKPGLLVGAQADLIHKARLRFKPTRTVIDAGGQGKLTLEEFNARYGASAGGRALPADKQGKIEAIGMLNSDLRSASLKLYMPEAEPLGSELMHLPWASDDKDKEHPAFPNHCCDTLLYAWRKHRAYQAKARARDKTAEDLENERIEARNAKARAGQRR